MSRLVQAALALALLAALAAPGDADAQHKIVLKFAHITPTTSPYHDGAMKFKEVPERLSGGRSAASETMKASAESVQAFGASATLPEMYTSLRQGAVEGTHLDYIAPFTTEVFETIKYLTEPGASFLAEPRPLIMSARSLASLPADVQPGPAGGFERALFRERQTQAIGELRARGIIFTAIDDRAFLQRMQPIWRNIARELKAEDLLDEIIKAGQ